MAPIRFASGRGPAGRTWLTLPSGSERLVFGSDWSGPSTAPAPSVGSVTSSTTRDLAEQWDAFSTDRQLGRAREFLAGSGIRVG